jgi:hypothetical protein
MSRGKRSLRTLVQRFWEAVVPRGDARKPRGRSYAEFLDRLGMVLPAEIKLLDAAAQGGPASMGATRPSEMTAANQIRPAFLRFLALGGDERACVHERGLRLQGAWISGDLDFEACRLAVPIRLDWCNIEGRLSLRDADLPGLFLERTSIQGIDAERCNCRGSVHINDTVIDGEAFLRGARIGGDFDCVGSHFVGEADDCLHCDRVQISGDVVLGQPFNNNALYAHRGVNFSGAQVDGDFRSNGVTFGGEVWFIGTRIKGDLDLSRISLTHGRSELVLTRADIGGRIFFRKVTGAAKSITLRAASVAAIVDDMDGWKIADELLLDGFRYNRFVDTNIQDGSEVWVHHSSPTDSKSRIEWLDRQRAEDPTTDFKPQPWEQLIKVLREIGLEDRAKTVAIAKQDRIHKPKRLSEALHRIYGWLCRYGYRPSLLIVWALLVALIGAILFQRAAVLGVMAPTDWRVIADTTDPGCRPERGGNWTTCQSLHRRGYPSFDPVVYSFDLIVPVIATQQTKDWAPATTWRCQHRNLLGFCVLPLQENVISTTSGYWWLGLAFWLLARIVTLAGWAFGLMFVAIVSGLIKRD